jgi:hypothetical protein
MMILLSDYITILNSLIDHIQKHRDDINTRTIDEANASSSDIHLREYIINY